MSSLTTTSRSSNPPAQSMYAASVNPPRRAKLQAAASLLPALLPSPPASASPPPGFPVPGVSQSSDSVQPRKKRGRKPAAGGCSRAAREAARKANHSRIEKARRGKINTALQELKSLVPADFAPSKGEDDGDDDGEDELVSPTSSSKDPGKKTIPEREFKLDILERTVLFVRALLRRVEGDEHSRTSGAVKQTFDGCGCQCHSGSITRKRKATEEGKDKLGQKRCRTAVLANDEEDHLAGLDDVENEDAEVKSCTDSEVDMDLAEDAEPATSSSSTPKVKTSRICLPSISELLSSSVSLRPVQTAVTQLPSPSLSPHSFLHYYHCGKEYKAIDRQNNLDLSPSLSPSASLRVLLPSRAETQHEERLREGQGNTSDACVSCPVGMSTLLTPPSTTLTSRHNSLTPALHLPSSALDVRGGAPKDASTSGTDIEADAEDGGAHTASLALLQMRSRSYSRSGSGVSGTDGRIASGSLERLGLTPGGLLGIKTGKKS